jgi:tryptophan synthase beta chain
VGPHHSYLKDLGRAEYHAIDDTACLDAFMKLSRLEGIIPALESAHALAWVMQEAKNLGAETHVLINMSGRGDKDVDFVAEKLSL